MGNAVKHRFQNTARRLVAMFLVAGIAGSLGVAIYHPSHAAAMSGSDFNPGRIIDNSIFENKNALSVQEIQNFLSSKVVNSVTGKTGCDTRGSTLTNHPNGSGGYYNRAQWTSLYYYGHADGLDANGSPILFTCLKDYVENTSTLQNNIWNPSASIPGGISAAQIIWNAAQSYSISPEVILVTLQKEQGLVTDDWPWPNEYQSAMGYACPDTSVCNAKYYGFYNQVDNAAWQFRYYLDHPGAYNYWVGNNYIQYNPDASCGGSVVNIQNSATAALYIYTPYQPNARALLNVSDSSNGGTGDGCSAYGNRNFWWYFTKWFGTTYLTIGVMYEVGDAAVDSSGDAATIPIKLSGPPLSTVTLNFGVSDTSLAKTIGNASLTFSPSNWNTPQKITVQGLASSSSSKDFLLKVMSINSPDGAYSQSITPLLNVQPVLWSNLNEDAITRLYNSSTGLHAYAVTPTDIAALQSNGYQVELTEGYQCFGSIDTPLAVDNAIGLLRTFNSPDVANKGGANLMILPSNGNGSIPVTIWKNPAGTDSVMNQDSDASGQDYLTASGWSVVAHTLLCNNGDRPIYRLNDNTTSTHFYTASAAETFSLLNYNFKYEGVAFYTNSANSVPVYRLNDPIYKTHFYTESAAERDAAEQVGFQYEGVAFYASADTTRPVYRLNDTIHHTHFYTALAAERDAAEQVGFQYEGIAYYLR